MTKTLKTETKKSAGTHALIAVVLWALSGIPAQARQATPPPVAEPPTASQQDAPTPVGVDAQQGASKPGQPVEPVPATQDGLDYLQRLPILGNFFQDGKQKDDPRYGLFGGADSTVFPVTPATQKMADRTRRIMVLRQLLSLGFTQKDIETALPLLHRLHDLKSPAPANPEKAMEEEYQALLKASPKDPLPPNSALKIMDASRYYREEQSKIWTEMSQRLGKSKSDGLSRLLGQSSNWSDIILTSLRTSTIPRYNLYADLTSPVVQSPKATTPPTAPDRPMDSNGPIVPPTPEAVDPFRANGPLQTKPAGKQLNITTNGSVQDRNAGTRYDITRVFLSAPSARISLAELIDLMQEKLKAMSDAPTKR